MSSKASIAVAYIDGADRCTTCRMRESVCHASINTTRTQPEASSGTRRGESLKAHSRQCAGTKLKRAQDSLPSHNAHCTALGSIHKT